MINVLIVEDDPMVAQINSNYIQRLSHFKVEGVVRNGAEALDYLRLHKNINLLILDIYMPQMTGIELLEEIRKSFNEVDVIFVTAAKEKKTIQRGLQLGAVDYLLKPFTFERIKLALEEYQQKYLLFQKSEVVSQEQLDKLFKVSDNSSLPKGIHKFTLKRIKAIIDETDNHQLDLHEISQKLSLSLVTLRFYLDYLVSEGNLIKKTQYGTVGRPTYVYNKKINI